MRSIITFSQNNCFVANIWSNYEYSLWQLYSINALLSQCQFISQFAYYMWILWWFLSIHTNYVPQPENSKIMILFDKESIFPATQSTRSNLVFDKNNKEMNTNSEVDCKLHNIDWIVMRCFYGTQQFNDIVCVCLGKIYDAQWSRT